MTFAEAFAKLCALAPSYCCLRVEATRTTDGAIEVVWSTYDTTRSPGWSADYPTSDEALKAYLCNGEPPPPPQTVDGIDPMVEATPPP